VVDQLGLALLIGHSPHLLMEETTRQKRVSIYKESTLERCGEQCIATVWRADGQVMEGCEPDDHGTPDQKNGEEERV